MSIKLHYAGQIGTQGFGWATCNNNLFRALYQHFKPVENPMDADVVFMPLADHDFNPATNARARWNVAYTFFEYPLGPNAAANAAKYDIVFCGSTWCLDRMQEAGITNGQVLIQGVDHSVFYPRPRVPDGKFKIFSGGKFEYRKGQDLVIAAFREFAEDHPEAHLVCAWWNPWPQLILQALGLMDLELPNAGNGPQEDFFSALLIANGISEDRFTILPRLSHAGLAEAMAQTECGLFPNRCEGGTNLVMMEYAATFSPVVANTLTGHSDVEDLIDVSIPACYDSMKWAVQSAPSIRNCLDYVYCNRNAHFKPHWDWKQTAKTVANAIERLTVAV